MYSLLLFRGVLGFQCLCRLLPNTYKTAYFCNLCNTWEVGLNIFRVIFQLQTAIICAFCCVSVKCEIPGIVDNRKLGFYSTLFLTYFH